MYLKNRRILNSRFILFTVDVETLKRVLKDVVTSDPAFVRGIVPETIRGDN